MKDDAKNLSNEENSHGNGDERFRNQELWLWEIFYNRGHLWKFVFWNNNIYNNSFSGIVESSYSGI